MNIDINTVLILIATMIFGGLAGATFTVWNNKQSEKMTLSIQLIENFLKEYNEVARVLWVLGEKRDIAKNINSIRRIGDWLNLIAHLKLNNAIKWEVVDKLAMYKTMTLFVNKINTCRGSTDSTFDDAEVWWPDLYNVVKKGVEQDE